MDGYIFITMNDEAKEALSEVISMHDDLYKALIAHIDQCVFRDRVAYCRLDSTPEEIYRVTIEAVDRVLQDWGFDAGTYAHSEYALGEPSNKFIN